jgi:hypothetical protein
MAVVGLLVVAAGTAYVVRRDDPAGAADTTAEAGPVLLAENVTAGGVLTGQARALADALTSRGLACSVRFTAVDGGQAGCFTFAEADRIASEVVYQYQPDGAVIGFNVKIRTPEPLDTRPVLRPLVGAVQAVLFPADGAKATRLLDAWGGFATGSWGALEAVTRGPETLFNGRKAGSTAVAVPVLHLDTTEQKLAETLSGSGFTCARDNESCRGQYAGKPGLTVQMSGPDTGITYLLAAATAGPNTTKAFTTLQGQLLDHLAGPAVTPLHQWLTEHQDGRSHSAYVAGWRVDLQSFHPVANPKQPPGHLRLSLFNEEIWQVPE